MFESRWRALLLSDVTVNVCNWVTFPHPLLNVIFFFGLAFCAERVNLLCCRPLKL